jgi:hypothetical protein
MLERDLGRKTALLIILIVASSAGALAKDAIPSQLGDGAWQFVVSGDSRNCGDVIMPAIAADSARYAPAFYWHLGDLRAIYKIDEDMLDASTKMGQTLTCEAYHKQAWNDFIANQIAPFRDTPFYVGIGNHEVIWPKSEDAFTAQFADWLNAPLFRSQRLRDDPDDHLLKPYYHWIQGGVGFMYLDNASGMFSDEQLAWFDRVLASDGKNQNVLSLVVAMHEALPDSIAHDHSMCDEAAGNTKGCPSGRHVYQALLLFHKRNGKPVYLLANHSHFYMPEIFGNLPADQRLPGWIAGTAGAVRYAKPKDAPAGTKTDTYGYLLATVDGKGSIRFDFQEIQQSQVPEMVMQRYSSTLVPWCFAHNSRNVDPGAEDKKYFCPPPAPAAAAKP